MTSRRSTTSRPASDTWIARAKDGKPTLYSYLWGLVPYWSKDPKKGVRPVNARAETAHEKPMFRKLIRERRCLIPANCYYEWKQIRSGSGPTASGWRTNRRSSSVACGTCGTREKRMLFTFTVLTTFPNEVSATVHDRMPLIVQPKDYARWLDRENEEIEDILAPYPAEGMIAYPVSRRVNDPKNDDAKLIEPEAE